MATKVYALTTSGLKSIPLNAVPPDAWHSLTNASDNGDVQKLYDSVPWLYRGVNLIADALATLRWAFHNSAGDEVEDPTLPFLFDTTEVMNAAAGDALLYGAIYWHKGVNAARKPTLCKRLHPVTITPKYDNEEGLVLFERRIGGYMIPLPVEDVAFLWLINRKAERGPGTPPAVVALKAAGLLDYISTYSSNFFASGAVTPTVLYVDGNPSDADLDAMESRLRRMAAGIAKAFKIVMLRFKPEVVQLGSTPDKLALTELTSSQREDVATALGVPHSLLFSNASNFATAHQDDLHFYDKTVIPLAERIAKSLTEQVFSQFGLELKPHPEQLELYQAMESEKSEALSMMRDRKVITINEFRGAMGWETVDGDPRLDELLPEEQEREGKDMLPPYDENAAQRLAELRQIQRFVTRRVKEGKTLTRPLSYKLLPPSLVSALRGSLENVRTVDEVRRVFADARQWVSYP